MAYVSRGVVTTTFTAYDSMHPDNVQELSVSGKISPARLAARARKIIGPTAAVRDVVTETRQIPLLSLSPPSSPRALP